MRTYTKHTENLIKRLQNPSVAKLKFSDKEKKKFIAEKKTIGNTEVSMAQGVFGNEDVGELIKGSMYVSSNKVDDDVFIKVYSAGWQVLLQLSPSALKVFHVVHQYVLEHPKDDKIVLNYTSLKEREIVSISRTTFNSGLNELLNKECLYQTFDPTVYFLNVKYFFNGERHYLIQEYIRDKKSSKISKNEPALLTE